jgi:hypothetical protein
MRVRVQKSWTQRALMLSKPDYSDGDLLNQRFICKISSFTRVLDFYPVNNCILISARLVEYKSNRAHAGNSLLIIK